MEYYALLLTLPLTDVDWTLGVSYTYNDLTETSI
jgi:hypothetical protein